MADSIWLLLLPTLVVLGTAIVVRSTLPALIAGVVVGHVMLDGIGAIDGLADSLVRQLQDRSVAWVLLVCGLFGSLIRLLMVAGGVSACGRLVSRSVSSGPAALLVAWVLGLIVFIDDYLNALLIGHTMRPVTDRLRVPRERLAYVVDSTAAPVCLLVPLSTWAVYVAGLLESTGAAAPGEGMATYVTVIPFALYGWIAVLIVPLVVSGVLPSWGLMRRADERVAAGGDVAPPDSPSADALPEEEDSGGGLADFFVPIGVLVAATVLSGNDALRGVIWAVVAAAVQQIVVRRRTTVAHVADEACSGIEAMIPSLVTILLAFVLKDVNDRLHLTARVIDSLSPLLDARLLPAVAFAGLSMVTFATGSFWGTYAIALPIVLPLAATLGADQTLTIAAVVSAGGFGSHACFFGDTTVLASQASGCENLAHSWSQLPYSLLAAALSLIGFIVLGCTWAA